MSITNSSEIRFRVYLSFLAMCVFGILILYKGSMIYFREGHELRAMADSLHTRIAVIQPERGNIYSEDGSFLSSSIPEFEVHLDLKAIPADTFSKYLEPLAHHLAELFAEHSWTEYKEILAHEYEQENRYYLLKRKVSYEQYLQLRKWQPFCKGPNKGGIIAESYTKRINPFRLLANRIIGLYRRNTQNVGIERRYDHYLSGSQGQRIERKIAGGTWMPVDGSEIDPENGKDVITTLDVNMQDIAENALLKQVTKEKASFGTCIIMEVKTGKIKALANLGVQTDGSYYEDFNYAFKRIEPGSTFKLVSLISLFRDKLIHIDDKIDCQGGSWKIGPFTIHDSHAGLGVLTIRDAFAHSSNVAFAKLIHTNYKDRIGTYWSDLHALHLDQKTGLDLDGEAMPRFKKDTVSKSRYTLAYLGTGYSILITPLHTCMVYNAIANRGVMMKPYLVNSVREYGKDILHFEPQALTEPLVDSASLAQIKEAMQEVVESGTGKELKNPYYTICGKTGTAQVADKGIHYADRVYHGSFVGFFPKENPKYTICVVLRTHKGSSNYYGGAIALPVFKEVANQLYARGYYKSDEQVAAVKSLTYPPLKNFTSNQWPVIARLFAIPVPAPVSQGWVRDWSADSSGHAAFTEVSFQQGLVPDVNGMGLRDAIYELEKAGLKVTVHGKGKVVKQSITPGQPCQKGGAIQIQLG